MHQILSFSFYIQCIVSVHGDRSISIIQLYNRNLNY